MSYKVTP
jgi:L-asparaginase/Glu-tRNA(Gln) amidotransferase subunit D